MNGEEIKSLDIVIRTGEDDLRQNSNAFIELELPSIHGSIGRDFGPRKNLNEGKLLANGSSHRFNWSLDGQHIGREDLTSFRLSYSSGQSGPFDTQDNWDVVGIKIIANYEDRSETIFQRDDEPVLRFTGKKASATFMFQIAPRAEP